MLSNTATPKYYARFREQVLRGDILVNEEISLQMNRIDAMIDNPDYYYDDHAIDGFIRFCENELTQTNGDDLELLESFKLWAEDALSWFYYEEKKVFFRNKKGGKGHYEYVKIKKRLRQKQFLIVARGAAKTMYASFLQAYFLVCDLQTTDQITVAPTMAQADEVLSPLRTAIARSRGPLFKFLTRGSQQATNNKANRPILESTKMGIQNHSTNSILHILPLAINKLQGYRCKYATVDEWLSGDLREDPIGAIEQSCAKGGQEYLIVATSSEGTVRNGSGDTIKLELLDILKGKYKNDHVSIWYYRLDTIDEVANPDNWIKANPNIGLTVSYETYQQDVERSEKAPATRNDILAKRFGIPMEGYTYFFTYEDTIPHNKCSFWSMPCALGADLSQGDDFCAFTFLFPLNDGCFGVKTRSYITKLSLDKQTLAMRVKYEEFINEGSLIIMDDGAVLDMMAVYEDLDNHISENEYDVVAFGYDPYNAKEFVDRYTSENGPYGVTKVIQGARTESVPLGELKILAEERMLIFDEELMKFAMGNCITMEDTNGNRKLLKMRHDAKIDNVAAMMDAYVAYKINVEAFE